MLGPDDWLRIDIARLLGAHYLEGDLAEAQLLLEADSEQRRPSRTPASGMAGPQEALLIDGIRNDCEDAVRAALLAGADPNQNVFGASPVAVAIRRGRPSIIRQLVDAGARLDLETDPRGRGVLAMTIIHGHARIALVLVEDCARYSEPFRAQLVGNVTMAVLAARYGMPEVFFALCRVGALENASTHPLRLAMKHGRPSVVLACLADPLLRLPAEGDVLDPTLLEGAADDARDALLSWRCDRALGVALDSAAPVTAASGVRGSSAPL